MYIFIIFSFLSLASAQYVLNTWTAQNSLLKNAYFTSCPIINNNIFCHENDTTLTMESAPITNNVIGTWNTQNSVPNYVYSCVNNNNDSIICVGNGDVYFAPVTSNIIDSWVSESNTITQLDSSTCNIDNNYIYCQQNQLSTGSNLIFSAPITNNVVGTWVTSSNNLPYNSIYGACAINNNNIYCTNGGGTSSGTNIESAPLNNGIVGTWTVQNSLLNNFYTGYCATYNNNIICADGSIANTTELAPITNNVIGTWTSQNNLINSFDAGYVTINNNYIYSIDGVRTVNVESTSISYIPLSATISLSNLTLDVGQAEVVSVNITGGTSPYTAKLYSSPTSLCTTGSTLVQTISGISSTGITKFNTLYPSVETYYCAFITDSESSPVTYQTATPFVIVSPALIAIPNNVTNYIPFNITNAQSTGTGKNFQQMITFNALAYTSLLSGHLQNVEFFYNNGTIIKSWLEGNISNEQQTTQLNTVSNIIYWLNLTSGISANSNVMINIGIAKISHNFFNNITTGEAPQLSLVFLQYGKYDNGNNIFNFYDNFAGTTLDSKWSYVANTGGNITVNNGATINGGTGSGDYTILYTTGTYNPSILDAMITQTTGNNEYNLAYSIGAPIIGHDNGFYNQYSSVYDLAGNGGSYTDDINGGGASLGSFSGTVTYPNIFSNTWATTGIENLMLNYISKLSLTNAQLTHQNSNIAIRVYPFGSPTSIGVQWVRIRTYPPSGIMPTVSTMPSAILTDNATRPQTATITSGSSITITSNSFIGGTTSLSYQWYSSTTSTCNSGSTLISGQTTLSTTQSPTSNTFYCVVATDKATTPETATSGTADITVSTSALTANILLESNTVIDSGQSSTLTAGATGGTAPYTFNYFSQASCAGTSIGSGTTLSVSPTATTTYSFNAVDSESTPVSVCSTSNSITVNPALTTSLLTDANILSYHYLSLIQLSNGSDLYAGSSGGGHVSIFNLVTNTTKTLTESGGASEQSLVLSPNNKLLYVGDSVGNLLYQINTSTDSNSLFTVNSSMLVGSMVLSKGGNTLYVGSDNSGYVYTYNTISKAPITFINIPSINSDSGYIIAMALDTNTNTLYVGDEASGDVFPINTTTNIVGSAIASQISSCSVYAMNISNNKNILYVGDGCNGNVTLINTLTNTVIKKIKTPIQYINAMTLSPNGATLYVGNYSNGNVYPINTSTDSVGRLIQTQASKVMALSVSHNNKDLYVANGNNNHIYKVLLPTEIYLDNGQHVNITDIWSGGTKNYNIKWLSGTSSTCSSNTNIFATYSNVDKTFNSINVNPTSTTYYCANITDSASTKSNILLFTTKVLVNSAQLADSWTVSNNPVNTGQYETFNVVISGGTSPYTYNFLVYNAIGDLVANNLVTNSLTTNTFTIKQLSSWGSGTFTANIITTDSATTPTSTSNTLTYTVVYPLSIPTLIPTINPIKSGHIETYNVGVYNGLAGYIINITNETSPTNSLLTSFGYKKWDKTINYPFNTSSLGCVYYNPYNSIYCMGGFDGTNYYNTTYYTKVNRNGTLNKWISTNTIPRASFASSCILNSNVIYCTGGTNSIIFSENTIYATITDNGVSTWKHASNSLPSTAGSLGGDESCVNGNNGYEYCINGNGWGLSGATNSIYSSKFLSNGDLGTWNLVSHSPSNIVQPDCQVYNNNIYCFGGQSNNGITVIDTNTIVYAPVLSSGNLGTWITSENTLPISINKGYISQYACKFNSNYIYCSSGAGVINNGANAIFSNRTFYSHVLSNNDIATWSNTTAYPITVDAEDCQISNLTSSMYCIGGAGLNQSISHKSNSIYYAPLTNNGIANTLSYNFSVSATKLSYFTYNAIVYDSNNPINVESSISNTITVDLNNSVPPTITISPSNSFTQGTNGAEATASSNSDNLKMFINGVLVSQGTSPITDSLSAYAIGTYTIKAEDTVTNLNATAIFYVSSSGGGGNPSTISTTTTFNNITAPTTVTNSSFLCSNLSSKLLLMTTNSSLPLYEQYILSIFGSGVKLSCASYNLMIPLWLIILIILLIIDIILIYKKNNAWKFVTLLIVIIIVLYVITTYIT
jgi:sugar lactone lactonase YvrE